jgi:hypothetical protein
MGGQLSEDGKWQWDGTKWAPITQETPRITIPEERPPSNPESITSVSNYSAPSTSSIHPHSANPTPPPESWIGDLENDGYEYIEYPGDSGITFYRSQGESRWEKCDDGESQIPQIEPSPDKFFSSEPITPPPIFDPPPPSPNDPPTIAQSNALGTPRRDYFAAMDTSSQFGRGKSRKGLKVAIGVVFVLALLIIMPSLLYFWTSNSAGGSESSYDDEEIDNDRDNDGVNDNWDNCISDYNPNQENFDGDSYGDVCDSDIDNDGYSNPNDFHDYGDGVVIFKWSYARIDDSEAYDSDGSGPDVYAKLFVDWDSDGSTDNTYTSPIINNIKEWSNLYEKELNPSDDRSQIKVTVRLYDEDVSSDDPLDYVEGSYTSHTYTIPLRESYYESKNNDGRDGVKGLKVTFIFDVDSL